MCFARSSLPATLNNLQSPLPTLFMELLSIKLFSCQTNDTLLKVVLGFANLSIVLMCIGCVHLAPHYISIYGFRSVKLESF